MTDDVSKQGVTNVKVFLYAKKWVDRVLIGRETGDYSPTYIQKTNDKGEFRFPMVQQEQYYIVFEPPAPYYDEKNIYEEGCIKADVITIGISTHSNKLIAYINKRLKKGVSISGKLDILGEAVSPGDITVISNCGNFKSYTPSGLSAAYQISGLLPTDDNTVSFSVQMKNKSGGVLQYNLTHNHVNLTDGTDKIGVDFHLNFDDPAAIAGQIVDPDGSPVQNCNISIDGYNENGEVVLSSFNRSFLIDGNFVFPGLPPGEYSIHVLKDAKIIASRKIRVEKGKQSNIRIVVDEKKISFSSRAGKPQRNADKNEADVVSGKTCNEIDEILMRANAQNAYRGAREKILNDCFGDSVLNCIAKRGLNKVKKVYYYCDYRCHGSYPGGDYIKLSGNANAFCKTCIFENLALHEILHAGFGDKGTEDDMDQREKRAEACANKCYASECQIHFYGGIPEDCQCVKDDDGDCT